MKKFIYTALAITGALFAACDNGDWSFDDFEYSAVYFANQSPVRRICLGEDVYSTELDNKHQFEIYATMGGVYSNQKDVTIDIKVDNTLCNNLLFEAGGSDVLAMPSSYYTLSANQIVIKKGEIMGCVGVQLTDAFFSDPKSLENNYVIPLVMTQVNGADSILQGTPLVASPNRVNSSDWETVPKDYTLYAVKYVNAYDANYLRRGKDVYTGAMNKTVVRHEEYVEKDETVTDITTRSLNTIAWKHPAKDADGNIANIELLMTFDGDGKCTVSSGTTGVTVSGSGQFVSKGEKNSWGNKDRDALYLNYTLEYSGVKCVTTDTLVVRDRGSVAEYFSPVMR